MCVSTTSNSVYGTQKLLNKWIFIRRVVEYIIELMNECSVGMEKWTNRTYSEESQNWKVVLKKTGWLIENFCDLDSQAKGFQLNLMEIESQ